MLKDLEEDHLVRLLYPPFAEGVGINPGKLADYPPGCAKTGPSTLTVRHGWLTHWCVFLKWRRPPAMTIANSATVKIRPTVDENFSHCPYRG